MNYLLTKRSGNAKTGPIPVSISSRKTCPSACPLAKGGCYANMGPLRMHWDRVTKRVAGTSWRTFLKNIKNLPAGQVWRHNQAGDLPGKDNVIDLVALKELVSANKGKKGFTYTHKPPTAENLDAIESANNNGFAVNLSANNVKHADLLSNLSVAPVVTVLPIDQKENTYTPEGRLVVVCPATKEESTITCEKCKLCAMPSRKVIIGFPAHGVAKRIASKIAEGK